MILHSILIFVIIPRIRKIKWGACKTKERKEKFQQNCCL